MSAVPTVSSTVSATNITLNANEYAYIAPGLVIGSTSNVAVSAALDSFIQVAGTLAGRQAIFLWNPGIHVVVESTGLLWGGLDAGILSFAGAGCIIENAGRIVGNAAGISLASTSVISEIFNSGLIQAWRGEALTVGEENAGLLSFDAGYILTNTGTIESKLAGSYSIQAKGATVVQSITNTGTLIGKVFLDGGDDVFDTSRGRTVGQIDLGAGNDTARGSAVADLVLGGIGNDTIIGYDGNDLLNGGTGADKLYGMRGADTLTGGANNDIFVFNTARNATNVDRITDFTHLQDKIHLDNAVMAQIGAAGALAPGKFYAAPGANHGHDANDRIIYNKTSGALYFDSNGSAAGGVTQIALLTTHPTLTATDFLVV